MLLIRINRGGNLTTIQDGGFKRMGFYGFPQSGFMDKHSAHIANLLVGNKKNTSCFEMTLVGGQFSFSEDCLIGITGADMSPMINGKSCRMYQTVSIKSGEVLSFGKAKNGLRSYLAVGGKWNIPKRYGSKSSYAYAGFGLNEGLNLKKGDIVEIKIPERERTMIKWPQQKCALGFKTISIQKGPEFDNLIKPDHLFKSFRIGLNSNRMASQLEGEPIGLRQDDRFETCVLWPGVIQCTPGGKLIVVLQDGQRTGGYPRVALLAPKEISKFNQISIKEEFKFVLAK